MHYIARYTVDKMHAYDLLGEGFNVVILTVSVTLKKYAYNVMIHFECTP